jgi:hypothetical protein
MTFGPDCSVSKMRLTTSFVQVQIKSMIFTNSAGNREDCPMVFCGLNFKKN